MGKNRPGTIGIDYTLIIVEMVINLEQQRTIGKRCKLLRLHRKTQRTIGKCCKQRGLHRTIGKCCKHRGLLKNVTNLKRTIRSIHLHSVLATTAQQEEPTPSVN